MSYDALSRMVGMTDKNGHTWSYTYDAKGQVTAMTQMDGTTVSYVYDATLLPSIMMPWAGLSV